MASARDKLRAFVKYNNDKIVSGVLELRTKRPQGEGWSEVPARCCSGVGIPTFFRTHGALKAFIKYAKDGYVVPSSTVLRSKAPKSVDGARWVEIPMSQCCVYTTTTTTTTTSTSTTTTTSSTTTTTTTLP